MLALDSLAQLPSYSFPIPNNSRCRCGCCGLSHIGNCCHDIHCCVEGICDEAIVLKRKLPPLDTFKENNGFARSLTPKSVPCMRPQTTYGDWCSCWGLQDGHANSVTFFVCSLFVVSVSPFLISRVETCCGCRPCAHYALSYTHL